MIVVKKLSAMHGRCFLPASVAQLTARPTSGGCGFEPRRVGNILSWRFDHEIFSTVILPSADSRRAVVRFWRKNVHNTLVNRLED